MTVLGLHPRLLEQLKFKTALFKACSNRGVIWRVNVFIFCKNKDNLYNFKRQPLLLQKSS